MKIIICGYHWIGCKAISEVLALGHELFVYTHENPPHVNSVVDFCTLQGIPYSTKKIEIDNLPFKPDVICSIYYRYIIDAQVIDMVQGKIFNLHPSLLPEYKGCSSITWALINGETEIGYTYHYIEEKVDTGNILLQHRLKIEDWDTQLTLYNRVMFEAAQYFNLVLEKVNNCDKGEPQSLGGDYYKRGCPFNGEIDPSWHLDKIERFIRAMNYPPLPYALVDNTEIKSLTDYLEWKIK